MSSMGILWPHLIKKHPTNLFIHDSSGFHALPQVFIKKHPTNLCIHDSNGFHALPQVLSLDDKSSS
jgi:hypothetical protein